MKQQQASAATAECSAALRDSQRSSRDTSARQRPRIAGRRQQPPPRQQPAMQQEQEAGGHARGRRLTSCRPTAVLRRMGAEGGAHRPPPPPPPPEYAAAAVRARRGPSESWLYSHFQQQQQQPAESLARLGFTLRKDESSATHLNFSDDTQYYNTEGSATAYWDGWDLPVSMKTVVGVLFMCVSVGKRLICAAPQNPLHRSQRSI
jgi:hypothetical protein